MDAIDSEILIEAVKKRAILYQANHKTYKDAAKKNLAWQEIADELGSPGKNC